MPAFQIYYQNLSTAPKVIIKATTREVRIPSMTYSGTQTGGGFAPDYFRYTSATVSGGTAQAPIAFRDGSTSTAVVNVGGTVSGTSTFIGSGLDLTSFNFTIARGNALVMNVPAAVTAHSLILLFAFEELPIQWAV